MKYGLLLVRAAAGLAVVGGASPVNLPHIDKAEPLDQGRSPKVEGGSGPESSLDAASPPVALGAPHEQSFESQKEAKRGGQTRPRVLGGSQPALAWLFGAGPSVAGAAILPDVRNADVSTPAGEDDSTSPGAASSVELAHFSPAPGFGAGGSGTDPGTIAGGGTGVPSGGTGDSGTGQAGGSVGGGATGGVPGGPGGGGIDHSGGGGPITPGEPVGSGTGTGGFPSGGGGDTGVGVDPVLPINPGDASHDPTGGNGDAGGIIPVGVVPEPANWVAMIAGFTLIGLLMRRRGAVQDAAPPRVTGT